MKFKVSYDGILPKSVMLDEVGYVRDDVVTQLRAELAAERELADRLAAAVKCAIDDTVKGIAAIRCSTAGALSQALTAHATRRNK